MRADIDLEAGEYGGRRTTRAQAFGSGSEASEDSGADFDGSNAELEGSDAELDRSNAVSEGSDAELEGTADEEASQSSDDSL